MTLTESINFKDYLSLLNELELKNVPKFLEYEGDFSLIVRSPKVSVVGSRDVSTNGILRAVEVVNELVRNNATIVSGLAKGVDTIAHKAAIASGGKTIAVLGTSLDKCSPIGNLELLNEIKKNHLAISQFKKDSRVFPSNFPQRNKTMALISDATIIIEATENSGTMHQGWEAIRLNRDLFILESVIAENKVSWAKEMIRYGATVVTRENYKDIFSNLSSYSPSLVGSF